MPFISTKDLMKKPVSGGSHFISTEELLGGRDEVFGLSTGSKTSLTAKLRPVLEGTKQIEDLMPEHKRESTRQLIDIQKEPTAYRERMVAEMLLADKLNQSKDVVQRQYDMIVKNMFGPKAVGSPAMVVDALSPYKRLPVLKAGKEPNFFVKMWESAKGKIGIEPDIGFYESNTRFSREAARGPLAVAALGTEKLQEKEEFERKGFAEAVRAGASQAGVRMAKSVAGHAQAFGEFADKLPKRYDNDTADSIAEWGRMMAEGADQYFAEHPDEAQQLQPGTGVLGTVWQFVSRPELIVQGVVETAPMLMEAFLGHVTGTKVAGAIGKGAKVLPVGGRITAMATEIFGLTYSEARDEGKTPEQALGQALLTSVGEGALEEWSLEKKIGIFRGTAGSLARHQMARAGAKIILGTRDSFQRGFIEEGGQALNANFWDMVFSDTSLTEDFFGRITEGVTEEAAAGGVLETALGGLFSLAGTGTRTVTDKTANERIEQLRSIVNKTTGMSAEQKTEANAELDRQRSDILAGKYSRQGTGEATAAFRESAKKAFNIDDKQAAAAMALVQAKADAENKTTDQWLTENIESVKAARFEQGQILFQEDDFSDLPFGKTFQETTELDKSIPPLTLSGGGPNPEFDRLNLAVVIDGDLHVGGTRIEGETHAKIIQRAIGKVVSGDPSIDIGIEEGLEDRIIRGVFDPGINHFSFGGEKEQHKRLVQNAVIAGKNVPLKVLKEFEGEQFADDAISELEADHPPRDTLFQEDIPSKKAAAQFAEDGKATLIAFEKADLSSLLHELGHVFRRTLDGRDLAAVERWVGVTDSNWTIKNEEKFARGFEKYLLDGKAPNHRLRSTFARLRQWLRAIYDNLRNSPLDIKISPEVRKAFDNMFVVREIHPGEMTFDEFIDKLGKELMDKNSLWVERYALAARETPFQMHQRLQKEWKAQQAEVTLGFTEEALESPLTNDQKLQINIIEASVLKPTAKGIADQKGLTVEELLDQNEGDRIVLSEVKRQLRAAFRAGNKAGIDAATKRFKDIATRARARKQLREHIKDLARKIAKRAPATVDLLQREAIAALQAGIDPSFRASKTLTQRQRIRDFLANNPEAGIPKKLAAIISRKALNEYTIADLEALAVERERLETIGKTKKRLRLEQEQRRRDKLAGEIIDNIVGDTRKETTWITPDKVNEADITLTEVKVEAEGVRYDVQYKGMSVVNGPQLVWHEDDSPQRLKQRVKRWLEAPQEAPINSATTKQNQALKFWRTFRAVTLTPTRIFDLFDGGKGTFDGPMHSVFADAVNQATDAKLIVQDSRADAGQAQLDKLGFTLKDLSQKRIVNGIEYSVQELIGIYGFNKNFKSRLALLFGNRLGAKTIADIVHHVETEDPRLAELSDWIIEEFEEHFERLEEAFVEVEEKRLEKEDNYLPMRRRELDYTPDRRQILNEMLERSTLKKAYAAKGFTISRQDIPPEFQKPIRLDLWSLWQEQVTRQEHFIHLGKLTADLHKITSGQGFKEAVRDKYGEEYLKVIRDYNSRVANPQTYKAYGYFEKKSRMLRKHAAVSYLAYNVVTVLKQLPSVLFYMPDAGPQHLMSSAAEFASNPRGLIDKVRRLDPQVAHPALERVLEELKISDRSQYEQIITRIGKNGMRGIYMMDSIARTIGWNAVYRNALDPNTGDGAVSEAEAIRQAQAVTLRTQPAANAKDISAIYTNSETMNWFLMFSNQLSKIYNIASYDMPRQLGNGQVQKAMLQLGGLSVSALVIWSISNRRLPEEPEDFADAISEQALNIIPLVGSAITSAKRGFGDSGIGAVSELAQIYARLEEIAAGKGDAKDLAAVLEALAVLYGVPSVQPKRIIKAIQREDPAELIGGGPRNRR
jgi:hypothetical protein